MCNLIEQLALEVLPNAPWEAIAPHWGRGVVLLVSGVTLPEAGVALAKDSVNVVDLWLTDGVLRHPTDEDAIHWEQADAIFEMLVIQPWVLIQLKQGLE